MVKLWAVRPSKLCVECEQRSLPRGVPSCFTTLIQSSQNGVVIVERWSIPSERIEDGEDGKRGLLFAPRLISCFFAPRPDDGMWNVVNWSDV